MAAVVIQVRDLALQVHVTHLHIVEPFVLIRLRGGEWCGVGEIIPHEQ